MVESAERDQSRIGDILVSVNGCIEEEENRVADMPSLDFMTPEIHPLFWCKSILALMRELIRVTSIRFKDSISNNTFDDTVTMEVLRSISRITSALRAYKILRVQENSFKKDTQNV